MSAHRGYQNEAIDAVFKEWEDNDSTLVVMPVGTGKTHVIAGVIQRIKGQSMVVAHREELIFQARDKIMQVAGIECDIEKAELVASTNLFNRNPCVIATVQTLVSGGDKKRMRRFNPMDFSCLVIDEAHHATADSYREVINYFMQGNPSLRLLGVTATPDRSDEEALGQVFKTVAYDYEVLDAIHDGYLVPVEQQMVTIEGLDFSQMRTTAGDLNGADLAEVMESEKNLQGVAGASIQIIGNRRTLAFAATVKQAETLCEIFNRHKSGMAGWVCGATEKGQRRETLSKFKSGELQVVCNVGVLTEGYNNPEVECVVMARPTKSRALYAQCCGRGMRPHDGTVDGLETPDERKEAISRSAKDSCLIIDFVGNSGKHKLMSTADILGGNVSDEALEAATERAKESSEPVRMSDLLEEEEKKIIEELERRRLAEQARKVKLVASTRYAMNRIDPFNAFDIVPTRERGWDTGKSLSEKQRGLLLKNGVNPDKLGYAAGRQLLNEMFRRWGMGLCSVKQAILLKKHGFETRNMTMKQASARIDELKKNGWKRNLNGIPI